MWSYVHIDERPGGYAVLTVAREPVNSLNLQLWSELLSALRHLEAQDSIKAVVIASGLKKDIFSAGNDLTELYAPLTNADKYRTFWEVSNKFLCQLYQTRLATVAAIRGACPAGGCIIALCCDYRVMTVDGVIGLNEVALGISVPKYWGQLMARTVGAVQAEHLLTTGELVSAADAQRMGMLDKLVEKAQLLGAAEALASKLAKLPAVPRAIVKRDFRKEFAEEWYAYALREPDASWPFLTDPRTVKMLGAVMQRLSKGSGRSKL